MHESLGTSTQRRRRRTDRRCLSTSAPHDTVDPSGRVERSQRSSDAYAHRRGRRQRCLAATISVSTIGAAKNDDAACVRVEHRSGAIGNFGAAPSRVPRSASAASHRANGVKERRLQSHIARSPPMLSRALPQTRAGDAIAAAGYYRRANGVATIAGDAMTARIDHTASVGRQVAKMREENGGVRATCREDAPHRERHRVACPSQGQCDPRRRAFTSVGTNTLLDPDAECRAARSPMKSAIFAAGTAQQRCRWRAASSRRRSNRRSIRTGVRSAPPSPMRRPSANHRQPGETCRMQAA